MLHFTLMGTNHRVLHTKNNLRSTSRKDEVGLGGAILHFVTQGCLGKRKVKGKNRAFHPQETTKHHQRMNHNKVSVSPARAPMTLAEWIMDSPSWNNGDSGGNPLLPVSRRVHPSVLSKLKKKEVVRSGGRIDEEGGLSFSTMTGSGTFKKQVSFKEPEVADVFILRDSP